EGDDSDYFVSPVGNDAPQTAQVTAIPLPPQSAGNRILTVCQPLLEDEFTKAQSSHDWFQDNVVGDPSNEQIINDYYEIRLNQLPSNSDEATSWGSLRGFTFREGRVEAVVSASSFSAATTRVGIW